MSTTNRGIRAIPLREALGAALFACVAAAHAAPGLGHHRPPAHEPAAAAPVAAAPDAPRPHATSPEARRPRAASGTDRGRRGADHDKHGAAHGGDQGAHGASHGKHGTAHGGDQGAHGAGRGTHGAAHGSDPSTHGTHGAPQGGDRGDHGAHGPGHAAPRGPGAGTGGADHGDGHGAAPGAAGAATPRTDHGARATGHGAGAGHGAMRPAGHDAHGGDRGGGPAAAAGASHGASRGAGGGAAGAGHGMAAGTAGGSGHAVHGAAPSGAADAHAGMDMDAMMKSMQGGAPPPDARDPDAYADGLSHGPMPGMDMADDERYGKLLVDRLEVQGRRRGDGSMQVLDAQAWWGGDIDKLWFKVDAERSGGRLGATRAELLWNRAIAPYWGLQAGVRHDFGEGPGRDWAALGVQGLAPYWFEVQATVYAGPSGRTALRLEAEYELLFTQRLILQPLLKASFHGRDDRERGIGAGLSHVEAGLRLRYEFSRKFAPYVGVSTDRDFGRTADFARAAGEAARHTRWVAGVRIWY